MSIQKLLFAQAEETSLPEVEMNFNQIIPFQRSTGLVAGDRLGWTVAINGDGTVCAMATPFSSSVRGQVQIYEKISGVWTYMATILPVPVGQINFGSSVDMDEAGTTVVVAAPYDTLNGLYTGSIYIFEKVGANWTQKLRSGYQPVTNGLYPNRVRISPDGRFVCGSNDRWNNNKGSATFWRKDETNAWVWAGHIVGTINGQQLGSSTDFDNEYSRCILSDQASGNGRAQVYTRLGSTYTLEANINSPSVSNLSFGSTVAMNGAGDEVAIRENSKVGNYSRAGRVHIYKRTGATWSAAQILTSSLPGTDYFFGQNLEFSKKGNRLAIFESPTTIPASKVGKVHIYKKVDDVWQWEGAFQTPNMTSVNNEQFSGFMRMSALGGQIAIGGYNSLTGVGFVAG